jgi:D-sedoheptulose 7-phosphate isomerase
MIIRSKAPVRISFGTCGDSDYYTDLIGYGNGINATINVYSYCEIHPRKDSKLVLRSLETRQVLTFDRLEDINLGDRSLNLMKVAALHYRNTGIEVVTYSDAPLNSGLGGSSAHAVALIKAFDSYNKVERTPEETAKLAYDWERNVLKLEGGYQDQWAAAFGGFNYMVFKKGQIDVCPLRLSDRDLEALEKDFVLVYVPREKEGSHEVHFEQRQKGPESVPILHMKRENILRLKEALEKRHFDEMGKLLHFDWKIKRQLAPSITNDRIERIYDAALDAGAQGGRFIGAGAGGSAIFYAPAKRSEVLKAMEKFGAKEIRFKFERKFGGQDFMESIRKDVQKHRDIVQAMLDDEKVLKTIEKISQKIIASYRNGGKLIVFGNGGSAADAQHIVAELVNYFRFDRPMLNAIALTVNTSVLTAIGNDSSYDNVFSRQIESLAANGDVVIGISTSGKAENILRALRKAKERDAAVVYFTGATGGRISDLLEKEGVIDIALKVPSADTPRIQEAHIMAGHIICEIVERELYGR